MTLRVLAILPVFGLLWAPPVLAARQPCPSPVVGVEADDAVSRRWPGVADRVRAAFGERDDVDACARVTLTGRGKDVAVDVALDDGRTASRTVAREEDVVPTLQALLLVPETRASDEDVAPEPEPASAVVASVSEKTPETASETHAPPPTHAPDPSRPPEHDAATDRHASSRRSLGFEIGVAAGVRAAMQATGASFAALSFLEVRGWLIGAQGRIENYGPTAGGADSTNLEVALLGGRRFGFGAFALDLVAGPGLGPLAGNESTAVTERNGVKELKFESKLSPVPHALAGARLSFNARGALRPFVGVDGDLAVGTSASVSGPAPVGASTGSSQSVVPVVEEPPAWSVGLSFGAAVGTL